MASRERKTADNTDEIDQLRRKKTLKLGLFFGCLALVPMCCLGSCGLIPFVPNEAAKGVLGIGGMIVSIGGLVFAILMGSDRHRYSRDLDMAVGADELGLRYKWQPPEKRLDLVRSFQLFQDSTSDAGRNSMTGDYEGRSILVLDYQCVWGVGAQATIATQTAILFEDALQNVPNLLIYPKDMLEKLADAVGLSKAVKVPNEEKFNKRYGLYTDRGVKASACISHELAAICVEEKKIALEINAGTLLVYWVETDIKPADLEDRLATALQIVEAMEGTEEA